MEEYLNQKEVDEFFEGLESAAQSIFCHRLDLPDFTEHSLTTATTSERFDFKYFAGNLGSACLDGFFIISQWTISDGEVTLSQEDIDSEYGSSVFLVDRSTFGLNFNDRSYYRSVDLLKCIYADENLFESVEEASLTYTRGMGEENLEAFALSERVNNNRELITYQDRSTVADILFRHAILL